MFRSPNATRSSWARLHAATFLISGMCPSQFNRRPKRLSGGTCRSSLLSEIMTRIQYGFTEREKQLDAPDGVTTLYLTRSIRVLQAVLKEFTASKMPLGANTMGQVRAISSFVPLPSKQLVSQIMEHVHEPIAQRYIQAVQRVIARLNPSTISSPRTLEDMKLCRLLLKCVTIMAVWVWQSTNTARKEITQRFEPWVSRS